VNKTQFIQELTERLGDHKTAAIALDEVLAVIVRTVQSGESVTLTGFGVFERRERAARTGRNPRTGEALAVAATAVPAFRPGAEFRGVISGSRALAEPAALGPRRGSTVRPAARRPLAAPAPVAAATTAADPKAEKSAAKKARPAAKPDKKAKAKSDKRADKGKKSKKK
jgi:DNA-binding protein HU-beta